MSLNSVQDITNHLVREADTSPEHKKHNNTTNNVCKSPCEVPKRAKVDSDGQITSVKEVAPPHVKDVGVVNLIFHFLKENGLNSTAEVLVKETNLGSEYSSTIIFKKLVLNGKWYDAERILPSLGISGKSVENIKFLICEQQFLELLANNDVLSALFILRNKISKYAVEPKKFEYLSSLIMSLDSPDGFIKCPYEKGSFKKSRKLLLSKLQEIIPAVACVPPNRLKVLIKQAIDYQISNCIYHIDADSVHSGLYTDHNCSRISFPTSTFCILKKHTDEVWYIKFSNNGEYLASASKDKTAIVWSMDKMSVHYMLPGHAEAISFVAWSNDDTKLLTISYDNTLRLWQMENGTCTTIFRVHTANVTSCAWLPSGDTFVSGGVDKNMCLCSTDGKLLHVWSGIRANDMSVTKDGKVLIVASERYIRLYDLIGDKSMIGLFAESEFITSINISAHTGYALVNLIGDAIHLWDFENRSMIMRYTGSSNKRFIIRSCFGGQDDRYILSGSEDCKIYVWHRERGVLIEVLPGHSGVVNCVSWCFSKSMFASSSDDHTIRIWISSSDPLHNSYLHAKHGS